jgi:hypothetical protein
MHVARGAIVDKISKEKIMNLYARHVVVGKKLKTSENLHDSVSVYTGSVSALQGTAALPHEF